MATKNEIWLSCFMARIIVNDLMPVDPTNERFNRAGWEESADEADALLEIYFKRRPTGPTPPKNKKGKMNE